MTPRRVVLVLGGGGVKAAAHVGAWRAIAEAGLVPSRYCGTSMGSVIGAAFAAGLTPAEIGVRMAAVEATDVARPRAEAQGLSEPSLFYLEPLRAMIERLVPARRFAELRTPLTVTTVHLESGQLVLFGQDGRDVPLVDALLASCALPFFYPPVVIEGKNYVDGGLRGVLPLEPASRMAADLVIAVDTGPGFDEPAGETETGPALLAAHNSATGILMAANTRAAVDLWRATPGLPPLIYVRPRVDRHVTFRVELAEKYAEEGYRAAKEALQAVSR